MESPGTLMTVEPQAMPNECPLRVLMVSNMYPSGEDPGYGIFVYDQVEELRRIGVTVDLLVTDRKPGTPLGRFMKYLGHFWNAWRHRSHRCDVVHLHFPAAPHLLAAAPVLLRSGRPYVLTIHRGELHKLPRRGIQRWLVSKFLAGAHKVIAVSRELADMAADLGAQTNQLVVINVGFNGDLFRPVHSEHRKAVRRKLGFSEERFCLLFVGALEPRKGLATLFDALDGIGQALAVELFIAGIGPSELELKERARQHRLREHIHWLGVVAHANLPELYVAADAFVLPSYAEGTPTVLLECMASGTPAIITRVGGVPDIIQHGENGLLFEPGDAEALQALIKELASNPQVARRMAERALSDVQAHSVHRQVTRLKEIYRAAT